ncbi:atlastin-3-like isoform X2 [Dysidea avara]|uniref:atlastin-3-like isoform X2 n=1 Tax=Dysidea avara TaxID=196820 RepID=UPI0033240E49
MMTTRTNRKRGHNNSEVSIERKRKKDDLTEKPVQIIYPDRDNHTFQLNIKKLEKILLSEEVKDSKVMVLSVAGAFRQGKSFLLNFFIKYLKAVESGGSQKKAWLGDGHKQWLTDGERNEGHAWQFSDDVNSPSARDEPLKGFSWKGGTSKVTTGIFMWSKPFILTEPETGEKIAVLLMDTEGTFDNETTMADWSAVFAMSTLISSVQVYNLSQMIHENELQNLHVFIDYGKSLMEECSDCKPFQSLLFLVRDWYHPDDYSFGSAGGQIYLNYVLQVSESQHQELRTVRTYIRRCFEEVKCFLLPHPGLKVATDKNFEGKLSHIEVNFLDNLTKLAFSLLHPTKLVAKKQQENYLTGEMLLERFKAYSEALQDSELSKPKAMFQAFAETSHMDELRKAKYYYMDNMKSLLNETRKYIDQRTFNRHHELYKKNAISQFIKAKKLGSDFYQQDYKDKLSQETDEAFKVFTRINNDRDVSGWLTSSLLCGVGYVGFGIAGTPVLPGVLAGAGVGALATWVDRRFNEGRITSQIIPSLPIIGGWWSRDNTQEDH